MLAIAGGKGGSGKTTTALGLAAALARKGQEPVVVDCDCDMPDLHLRARIDRTAGTDRLAAGASLQEACEHTSVASGVRVVTAGDRDRLGEALSRLGAVDAPVLLDCPPGVGPDAVRPLRHAGEAVLVTTDRPQSMRDTRVTANCLSELDTGLRGLLVRTTTDGASRGVSGDMPVLGRVNTVPDPFRDSNVRETWEIVISKIISDCDNGQAEYLTVGSQ